MSFKEPPFPWKWPFSLNSYLVDKSDYWISILLQINVAMHAREREFKISTHAIYGLKLYGYWWVGCLYMYATQCVCTTTKKLYPQQNTLYMGDQACITHLFIQTNDTNYQIGLFLQPPFNASFTTLCVMVLLLLLCLCN